MNNLTHEKFGVTMMISPPPPLKNFRNGSKASQNTARAALNIPGAANLGGAGDRFQQFAMTNNCP